MVCLLIRVFLFNLQITCSEDMTDFFKACGFRILETSEDRAIRRRWYFHREADTLCFGHLKAETAFWFMHMRVLREYAFSVQTSFKGFKNMPKILLAFHHCSFPLNRKCVSCLQIHTISSNTTVQFLLTLHISIDVDRYQAFSKNPQQGKKSLIVRPFKCYKIFNTVYL